MKLNDFISLQTHFEVAYPGSIINTLQHRPFYLESCIDDGIEQSESLSVPQFWKWQGFIAYSSPGDCGHNDFSKITILSGLQSQRRAEKTATMSVCLHLTVVNHMSVRWESFFREVVQRRKMRRRGRRRPSIPSLSLFLIYCLSLSPCLVIVLSLTFYSPHSLLRFTWITCLI